MPIQIPKTTPTRRRTHVCKLVNQVGECYSTKTCPFNRYISYLVCGFIPTAKEMGFLRGSAKPSMRNDLHWLNGSVGRRIYSGHKMGMVSERVALWLDE